MKEGSELVAYFAAERQAGALAAAIGLLAAGFSYLLWGTGTPWRAWRKARWLLLQASLLLVFDSFPSAAVADTAWLERLGKAEAGNIMAPEN
jgi:hypothetical protein